MKLVVTTVASGRFEFDMDPTDTVGLLKQALQRASGVCASAQQLHMHGTALVDSQTLQDCGVTENTKLHVILRLQCRACVVCMERTRVLALDPCGHLCTCDECAKQLSKCPICNKPIKSTLRVYEC
jgi:hypothetical protein